MLNARVNESQAGVKIAGRNINALRYADDSTQMAENDEQLNSLLIRVKEKSEKAGLKLNVQQTKIMVSGPITSWQIEGEKGEAVTGFSCTLNSPRMVILAMKLKHTCSLEGNL